jgi:hypothetical protein
MSVIQSTITEFLHWLRPEWNTFARIIDTLWHCVSDVWADVRDRHARLMDSDPRYPVALATGGTAVVKVFITNPAVVKALGVLLTELLDVQDEPRRSITSRSPYRSSGHGSSGYGSPGWSSRELGSTLWDRDDWDDEE